MEKWYVVDDGEVYNVFPESDLKQYGIERDQIVKVTTNMDMAFNYAEKLNKITSESIKLAILKESFFDSFSFIY